MKGSESSGSRVGQKWVYVGNNSLIYRRTLIVLPDKKVHWSNGHICGYSDVIFESGDFRLWDEYVIDQLLEKYK